MSSSSASRTSRPRRDRIADQRGCTSRDVQRHCCSRASSRRRCTRRHSSRPATSSTVSATRRRTTSRSWWKAIASLRSMPGFRSAGAQDQVIDLRNATVLPGLMDMHVHHHRRSRAPVTSWRATRNRRATMRSTAWCTRSARSRRGSRRCAIAATSCTTSPSACAMPSTPGKLPARASLPRAASLRAPAGTAISPTAGGRI